MARRVKFNQNFNVNRVVKKVVYTVLGLYVGGIVMDTFGDIMNCTASGFYDGVTLIGWTVTDNLVVNSSNAVCDTDLYGLSAGTYNNVITNVGTGGILSVIGVIAVASVVLEFISFY